MNRGPNFVPYLCCCTCFVFLEHKSCETCECEINAKLLLDSQTLTLGRKYADQVKKPFPELDNETLAEKDWPRDFYVFEGKENEPTIIYMPLFNRQNCKGLWHPHIQIVPDVSFQKQKCSESNMVIVPRTALIWGSMSFGNYKLQCWTKYNARHPIFKNFSCQWPFINDCDVYLDSLAVKFICINFIINYFFSASSFTKYCHKVNTKLDFSWYGWNSYSFHYKL